MADEPTPNLSFTGHLWREGWATCAVGDLKANGKIHKLKMDSETSGNTTLDGESPNQESGIFPNTEITYASVYDFLYQLYDDSLGNPSLIPPGTPAPDEDYVFEVKDNKVTNAHSFAAKMGIGKDEFENFDKDVLSDLRGLKSHDLLTNPQVTSTWEGSSYGKDREFLVELTWETTLDTRVEYSMSLSAELDIHHEVKFHKAFVSAVDDTRHATYTVGSKKKDPLFPDSIRESVEEMVDMIESHIQLLFRKHESSGLWWFDDEANDVIRPIYEGEDPNSPPEPGWTPVKGADYFSGHAASLFRIALRVARKRIRQFWSG